MDDSLLLDAVWAHPKIHDKNHAGFKNPAIKEAAWRIIAETVKALPNDCSDRWGTLRDRYNKEKHRMELASRSGSGAGGAGWINFSAMQFLHPFIRRRKSKDNFDRSSPSALATSDGSQTAHPDDVTPEFQFNSEGHMLVFENVGDEGAGADTVLQSLPPIVPSPSSSSAASRPTTPLGKTCMPTKAACLPLFGPTGRCNKKKKTEDLSMSLFTQTLSHLNSSIAKEEAKAATSSQSQQEMDPDHCIGKNVEATLRILPMVLKLSFRRKFRELLQEAEEAAFHHEQAQQKD